jgi:hypothetical protein
MRTQKHDLKKIIKVLESDLYYAEQERDALTVLRITEKLDVLKSTLINIR